MPPYSDAPRSQGHRGPSRRCPNHSPELSSHVHPGTDPTVEGASELREGRLVALVPQLPQELNNTPQKVCNLSTPFRLTAIKKPERNKCQRGCGETGTLVHCEWGWKMGQPLGKQYGGS